MFLITAILHPFRLFIFPRLQQNPYSVANRGRTETAAGAAGRFRSLGSRRKAGYNPKKGAKDQACSDFFKKITGRGLFVVLFFAHFRPNARFSCAKWLTFLVLYVKIKQKKRSCPYRFATEYGFCCSRRRKRLFLFFR